MALKLNNTLSVAGMTCDYLRVDRTSTQYRKQNSVAIVRLYKSKTYAQGKTDVEEVAQANASLGDALLPSNVQGKSDQKEAAYDKLKTMDSFSIAGTEVDLTQATDV